MSNVAGAQSEENIKVLYEFTPIHEWHVGETKGKTVVRVIELRNGKRFLDIREFNSRPDYTGYTKRGLRFNFNELKMLEVIIPIAKDKLRLKDPECNTQTVTDVKEVMQPGS